MINRSSKFRDFERLIVVGSIKWSDEYGSHNTSFVYERNSGFRLFDDLEDEDVLNINDQNIIVVAEGNISYDSIYNFKLYDIEDDVKYWSIYNWYQDICLNSIVDFNNKGTILGCVKYLDPSLEDAVMEPFFDDQEFLGRPDGISSVPVKLNENDQFIGYYKKTYESSLINSYLYSNEEYHVFEGKALDLNNKGEVLGEFTSYRSGGFFWSRETGQINLDRILSTYDNTLNVEFVSSINDKGDILVEAKDHQGQEYLLLLSKQHE